MRTRSPVEEVAGRGALILYMWRVIPDEDAITARRICAGELSPALFIFRTRNALERAYHDTGECTAIPARQYIRSG